jgi:hypothetical protein
MHLAGRSEDVDLAQWTLLLMFAASFYNVGTIWSPQMGWRLWPYVAPGDFRHIPWRVVEDDQASRLPCRGDCIPRITRADLVATGGSWDGANLAERWVASCYLRVDSCILGPLARADLLREAH